MLSIRIAHTLSKDSPLPEMCYTAVHCYPSSVTQTLMMCPNFSQCPVWRPFPPWDARHFATHWTLEKSLTYTDLRMSVHLLLIPTCTTKCKTPYKVSPRLFLQRPFQSRRSNPPGSGLWLRLWDWIPSPPGQNSTETWHCKLICWTTHLGA